MSKICSSCNTENVDESKFCRKCGLEILSSKIFNDESSLNQSSRETTITESSQKKSEIINSNPYIAVILSIIIPGLGLVYTGKLSLVIKSVITYILFLAFYSWSGFIHMQYGGAILFIFSSIVYLISIMYSFMIAKKPTKQTYDRPWITLVYSIGVVIYAYLFPIIAEDFLGFRAFRLPSNSMSYSLVMGDHIIVNTWAYNNKTTPSRGDIIAFHYPHNTNQEFLKRCVALPGDELFVSEKDLYIHHNEGDKWINENFKNHEVVVFAGKLWVKNPYMKEHPGIHHDEKIINNGNYPMPLFYFDPIKVDADHYFMMGDNRDHSNDSRFWGGVHKEYVIGTVSSIYFSEDEYSVNFNRIGSSVDN